MIITRKALPRRTFLRGVGATLALPLIDAMVPAFSATVKTAAKPVCRMGFIYVPNGVAMNDSLNYWTPKGAGTEFTLSPILAPLAPYRDRLTIVSGLAQKQGESLGERLEGAETQVAREKEDPVVPLRQLDQRGGERGSHALPPRRAASISSSASRYCSSDIGR